MRNAQCSIKISVTRGGFSALTRSGDGAELSAHRVTLVGRGENPAGIEPLFPLEHSFFLVLFSLNDQRKKYEELSSALRVLRGQMHGAEVVR